MTAVVGEMITTVRREYDTLIYAFELKPPETTQIYITIALLVEIYPLIADLLTGYDVLVLGTIEFQVVGYDREKRALICQRLTQL